MALRGEARPRTSNGLLCREIEVQQVLHDQQQVSQGLDTVNALEDLALSGDLGYHVLTYRKL